MDDNPTKTFRNRPYLTGSRSPWEGATHLQPCGKRIQPRMKLGRFIVDTHVHAQRHAVRVQAHDDEASYERIAEKMVAATPAPEADEDDEVIVYDNSDRLLYDMEQYGVDMCVLLAGAGMENTINYEIAQEHPEKFVCAAIPVKTPKRHRWGEEEWSREAALAEIDDWLDKEPFKLIGEGSGLSDPRREEKATWPERKEELRAVFDLAADHDVPVSWHTGHVSGYGTGGSFSVDTGDPTLAGEIKAEYPEVPIIFNHGGMQAHWRENYVDECCQVAASWDDVYLEVGLYWADLLEKPYYDPNIGPEQMLWGTDWGASMPQVSRPGQDPSFYFDQVNHRGIPAHQCDYWGGAYRQLLKFALENDVEQDKLNLILGGNIVRLLDLEVPHTRMFENYLQT